MVNPKVYSNAVNRVESDLNSSSKHFFWHASIYQLTFRIGLSKKYILSSTKKVAYLIAVLEVEDDDVMDVFGDDACKRARSEELL